MTQLEDPGMHSSSKGGRLESCAEGMQIQSICKIRDTECKRDPASCSQIVANAALGSTRSLEPQKCTKY